MRGARLAGVAIVALMLAACGSFGSQTPEPQAIDVMAGRWILAEANAPTCGVNFSGAAGVKQGTLVPEGGCPEKFYLSRSWALEQNALTIIDDDGQPLAQLTYANGGFAGQSAAGTPVMLSRQQDSP